MNKSVKCEGIKCKDRRRKIHYTLLMKHDGGWLVKGLICKDCRSSYRRPKHKVFKLEPRCHT